jgi:hypothetical protein
MATLQPFVWTNPLSRATLPRAPLSSVNVYPAAAGVDLPMVSRLDRDGLEPR